MECVLCETTNIQNLKEHYIKVHNVDENNVFFKKFIEQNQKVVIHRRKCNLCKEFVFCNKAEHDFVRHYDSGFGFGNNSSSGGKGNQISKPLNVVSLGSVKKIEITFKEHSSYYDFYDSVALVDSFLAEIKDLVPRYDKDVLIRAGFSIENVQQVLSNDYSDPLVQTRYWSTEPFQAKSFNDFISFKIRESILKRVIKNNLSGSAWHFNKFNYVNIKIVNVPLDLIR